MSEKDINILKNAWQEMDNGNYVKAIELFKNLNASYGGLFDIIIEIAERKKVIKSKKTWKRIKVSVILPVYNNAQFLEECINSVINQSLNEIEIIIINDGSTDSDAINILNYFSDTDKRIKIVNKANGGYGQAINWGIRRAKGEYIGIVESDDFIHHKMYETLYRYAKNYEVDVVKCNFSRFMTKDNKKYFEEVKISNNPKNYLRVINPKFCPEILRLYTLNQNGLYKREYIQTNNIQANETPGASYQDNGLFFLLMAYAESILCINDNLYFLRRDNETSSVYSKCKPFASFDEYKYIKNIIDSDQKLKNRFNGIFYVKKFNNLLTNLYRIDRINFIKYFNKLYSEFKYAKDKQEIENDAFNMYELNSLQKLLNNTKAYLEYKITHPVSWNPLGNLKKKYITENEK